LELSFITTGDGGIAGIGFKHGSVATRRLRLHLENCGRVPEHGVGYPHRFAGGEEGLAHDEQLAERGLVDEPRSKPPSPLVAQAKRVATQDGKEATFHVRDLLGEQLDSAALRPSVLDNLSSGSTRYCARFSRGTFVSFGGSGLDNFEPAEQ
jgi:hypothetical protein